MSGPRQTAIYSEKRTSDHVPKEAIAALNFDMGPEEAVDYRQRGQWVRAAILGANDGLLSTASLMLGVGAVEDDSKPMVISGLAGLVAGACSMGIGEFVSVCSQRDIEISNRKGDVERSASGVCQLTEEADELPNPVKAACASAISFCVGSAVPLVAAAFIEERVVRLVVTVCVSSAALGAFGLVGAYLGRSPLLKSSLRVLLGGWLAMSITFGMLYLFAFTPKRR